MQLGMGFSGYNFIDPGNRLYFASANSKENRPTMEQEESLLEADATMVSGKAPDGGAEKNLVGTLFAQKYQVLEFLGRGGMSVVYKARHLMMNKDVALKVLHSHLCNDSASIRRFKQEALAVSALTHANIVAVHDFGSDENKTPFLVMDFIEGISLSQKIKTGGPLSLDSFLTIMAQVTSALEHAHQHGVVHRDLKPSNIMVSSSSGKESVKIVDFGIAKIVASGSDSAQQLTQTGELFGSPLYMSPEQCNGTPLDRRSDIYSLGCVMYEALSGKPPYIGENVFETINKHLNETPPPLEAEQLDADVTRKLELIVLKCMAKAPADRYQSAAEIESALRSLSLSCKTGIFGRLGAAWELASAKRAARRKSKMPLLVMTLTTVSFLSMVSMICLLGAFIDSNYQAKELSDSRRIITENSLVQLDFIRMNQVGELYGMSRRTPEVLARYRQEEEIFRQRLDKVRTCLRNKPAQLARFNEFEPEIDRLLSESWTLLKSMPREASWQDYQLGMQLKLRQAKGLRILNTMAIEAKNVDAQEARVERSREWVLYLSALCVLLNAAVVVSLIVYFARGTPKRLKELAANAARLSSAKRGEAVDEIAELDLVLQELASALSEAEQREQVLLSVVKSQSTQDLAEETSTIKTGKKTTEVE
jgi:serine/threonine protein kinase